MRGLPHRTIFFHSAPSPWHSLSLSKLYFSKFRILPLPKGSTKVTVFLRVGRTFLSPASRSKALARPRTFWGLPSQCPCLLSNCSETSGTSLSFKNRLLATHCARIDRRRVVFQRSWSANLKFCLSPSHTRTLQARKENHRISSEFYPTLSLRPFQIRRLNSKHQTRSVSRYVRTPPRTTILTPWVVRNSTTDLVPRTIWGAYSVFSHPCRASNRWKTSRRSQYIQCGQIQQDEEREAARAMEATKLSSFVLLL